MAEQQTDQGSKAPAAPERLERLDGPLLRLICVLVSGAVLALVNTTVIGVALPGIAGDLNAGLAAASWAGTGYILALAVAIALSGWATVRLG